MSEYRGVYVGGYERLRGKTAMIRHRSGHVLAQFDEALLPLDPTKPVDLDANCHNSLGHGWHAFGYDEWDIQEVSYVVQDR